MNQDQLINAACNIARAEVRRNEIPRAIEDAMAERCEIQGHQMENACSIAFQIYQICKWCRKETTRSRGLFNDF